MSDNFVQGFIEREDDPIVLDQFIPKLVKRLYERIGKKSFSKLILFGFSVNMKWLYRISKENGISPILSDWRENFLSYDCGGQDLQLLDDILIDKDTLIVVCPEEISSIKGAIKYLMQDKFKDIPVIYDRQEIYDPFNQQQPYKGIAERARLRAVSMISENQLFDLIQYIDITKHIEGDVVEFGSLYGGSGAVIAEAVKYYNEKPLWLFDSFTGIPKSKYGLDDYWDGSFSDNSFKEVSVAFEDMKNVKVVKGNILETYDKIKNSISFGYLASDTLETAESLLNFMWPKLSPGGIIAICDYGSIPNCIPLTVYTDEFFKDKKDALIFYPSKIGIFIMKRN